MIKLLTTIALLTAVMLFAGFVRRNLPVYDRVTRALPHRAGRLLAWSLVVPLALFDMLLCAASAIVLVAILAMIAHAVMA